ncbi:MAG: sigma 54-interacting transcriptional regulator [Desulfobacteraceae bacterium]|jgi:transcriptional regulator with GAF, ATPase, and Fis domain
MEQSTFFREATLAICGHLDIERSLFAAFQVLQQWMPLDRIYAQLYEPGMNCMHFIAKASQRGGESQNFPLPLPEEAKRMAQSMRACTEDDPSHFIHFENEPDDVSLYIFDKLKIPISSILGLPLIIEGEPFGAYFLTAEGTGRYTRQHARMLAALREPFYIALSNAIRHRSIMQLKNLLADDNRYLHSELSRKLGSDIVGADFGLRGVMELVRQVAAINSPVLLLGETGVGKDVIANAIHQLSPRRKKPFIAVNCGGIPENLIDSELFGHEKGAFTGALAQKRGRFERADKGTIFLDEIGELPPQAQVRLLRVLQDKVIERIGTTAPVQLDLRIIAATNRDLEKMVRQGEFREDLWFRLNVFPITIPPLRDRLYDIPALVDYFIQQKARDLNLPQIPKLADGALEGLTDYRWPGNVRELQNIVERSLILHPRGPVSFDHLGHKQLCKRPAETQTEEGPYLLDDVVTAHINKVLVKTGGKVHGPNGAANLLGVNASTLRNKMNKLGIKFGRKH